MKGIHIMKTKQTHKYRTWSRIHIMVGVLFATGLVTVNTTFATSLNLDFGLSGGVPSSSFGAASGQMGNWNRITAFNTVSGIVDTSGSATSVTLAISAMSMGGGAGLPDGDGNNLMEDNFHSGPGNTWNLSMTGLENGTYDVYLYEPHNNLVGTGSGEVNGSAFSDINGNFLSGVFIEGSNYHLLSGVAVSGNILGFASSLSDYSGLAGLQLVQAPIPEPSTFGLFAVGLALLSYLGAKRRVTD